MNKLKTILVTVVAVLSLHMTISATDISNWAYNDYVSSNENGLLSYNVVSNDLRSNITREEFCELAMKLYEKLTGEILEVPQRIQFEDCGNIAVNQAYYNGIVNGVTENTFEPDRPVTRQEMAKVIMSVLTAGEIEVSHAAETAEDYIGRYADRYQISDWATSAMSTMVKHNLLSGNENNEIMPLNYATREQAIVCVNRCLNVFAKIAVRKYEMPVMQRPYYKQVVNGDVAVAWNALDGATGYHIIVKDFNDRYVRDYLVDGNTTSYTIPAWEISDGGYSVTVGAIMNTGDKVFGLPVEFSKEPAYVPDEVIRQIYSEYVPVQNDVPAVQQPVQEVKVPETVSGKAAQVLAEAAKYLGIPYVYGGSTPAGFDCSGFVQYVYRNCGINLTRVSRDQYAKNGTYVSKNELQPGDLVFFGTNGVVGHVGIYVGDGKMIHSPSTGKSIMYASIETNYYITHYIGAKRVL